MNCRFPKGKIYFVELKKKKWQNYIRVDFSLNLFLDFSLNLFLNRFFFFQRQISGGKALIKLHILQDNYK